MYEDYQLSAAFMATGDSPFSQQQLRNRKPYNPAIYLSWHYGVVVGSEF
jgi:hypothetical protein